MTKLSIIIPIYNEAKIISNFLEKLQKTFKKVTCKYILLKFLI